MDMRAGSIGRAGFAGRNGLSSKAREEAVNAALARANEHKLETVRLSFADQHGILRGKTIIADGLAQAMENGCAMTSSLLVKDTSHHTVYPVWQKGAGLAMDEMTGAGDFIMLPDPDTFRVLPWAAGTGWVLCDIYFPDGSPVPFSTRHILKQALTRLSGAGYDYVSGLEAEFHIFKLVDAKLDAEHAGQPGTPPEVSLIHKGTQYLTEDRADEIGPILDILRRDLAALGLPLRTLEVEMGPSQVEFTFHPGPGLATADQMILFRSGVKQICRRQGFHATFMTRPHLPNILSSGWHLHQSLSDRKSGQNVLTPARAGDALSPAGKQFLAGLLAHAAETCVFTAPTINGYKRYQPHTLAPDRILWGRDNKGAMLRVIGGAGDPATRIENRIGEPAANPYLYLASQIHCGLDGMARKLTPPEPSDAPYADPAQRLPESLEKSVILLKNSSFYREVLGDRFVDYLVTIKEFEIARFQAAVTDWEQREYFSLF